MPIRRAESERLIESIPLILFLAWGSLFAGLITTFALSLVLQKSTGLKSHVMDSLLTRECMSSRVRGARCRKPSSRSYRIDKDKAKLRATGKND